MSPRRMIFAIAVIVAIVSSHQVNAAIEIGFDSNSLGRTDDGSDGPVSLGFTANFFGVNQTELFVNNNGNVTFDGPLSTFTPFNLSSTGSPIIAPFFADVDTTRRGTPVTYGTGTFNGRNAFGVNWVNVDYFDSSPSHRNRNSFQLLLVDRSDIGFGDFDIIFNYDQIEWDSGQASGGNRNGLGGNSARAGFSNGTGSTGTFFELTGSAVNNAFLDTGANALISNSLNSPVAGRYVFSARNGSVLVTISEPASLALFGFGALGMFTVLVARRKFVA